VKITMVDPSSGQSYVSNTATMAIQ
jgi:hypothetical protein